MNTVLFDFASHMKFINKDTVLSTFADDSHVYKFFNLTVRNSKLKLENLIILGSITLDNHAEIEAINCVFINSNLNEYTIELNEHSQGYFEKCTFFDNGGTSIQVKSKSFVNVNMCTFYIDSLGIISNNANVHIRTPNYYFIDYTKEIDSKLILNKDRSCIANFLSIFNTSKNKLHNGNCAYFLYARESICTVVGNNLMFEDDFIYYKKYFENSNFLHNNINLSKTCYHYFTVKTNLAIRDLCLISNITNAFIYVNNSNLHIENVQIHGPKTLLISRHNSILEIVNSYFDSTYGNILNVHDSLSVCLKSVFEVQNTMYPPILTVKMSMIFDSCSIYGGNMNISIKSFSRIECKNCIFNIKDSRKGYYKCMFSKQGVVYNGSFLSVKDSECDSIFYDCNNESVLNFITQEENVKEVIDRENVMNDNRFCKFIFVMKRDLVMSLKNVDLDKLNAFQEDDNKNVKYIKCCFCEKYINSEEDYVLNPCCHWICKKCKNNDLIDTCRACQVRISNIKKINYKETCTKCNQNRSNVIYSCGCMNVCLKCLTDPLSCLECDKHVETYCFEDRCFCSNYFRTEK